MSRPVRRSLAVAVVAVLGLAGCGTLRALEQRTTQGPRAEQIWTFHVLAQNGREPSFEERHHWEEDLDRRIARFLADHPEVANSFEVTTFRFSRQVAVGMTREQVQILLGPAAATAASPAEIEKLARGFWPLVKDKATEAWVYPLGWRLYFAGPRVIDITQYVPRSAE